MTDIEQKALALLNAVAGTERYVDLYEEINEHYMKEALCRAIERHEAFRQEVSDALLRYHASSHVPHGLQDFIIPAPKPDPLAQTLGDFDGTLWEPEDVLRFRAALEVRGLKIVEVENDG